MRRSSISIAIIDAMASLLVLRHDDVDGAPYILAVYPSYSYDELRMRAFRIAYPGNDDIPSYV